VCDETVKIGEKITIHLYLPNDLDLMIKGSVSWKGAESVSGAPIGIKFAPYTNGSSCNSTETLEVLRSLEALYLDQEIKLKRAA
jgi:hypothetical protein